MQLIQMKWKISRLYMYIYTLYINVNVNYYSLSENARVVRVSDYEMRSLEQEPFEYSTEPRADEEEWDQMVKFAMRKVERYVPTLLFSCF